MKPQNKAMPSSYSFCRFCNRWPVLCTCARSGNKQSLHIHRSTNAWDNFLALSTWQLCIFIYDDCTSSDGAACIQVFFQSRLSEQL